MKKFSTLPHHFRTLTSTIVKLLWPSLRSKTLQTRVRVNKNQIRFLSERTTIICRKIGTLKQDYQTQRNSKLQTFLTLMASLMVNQMDQVGIAVGMKTITKKGGSIIKRSIGLFILRFNFLAWMRQSRCLCNQQARSSS